MRALLAALVVGLALVASATPPVWAHPRAAPPADPLAPITALALALGVALATRRHALVTGLALNEGRAPPAA